MKSVLQDILERVPGALGAAVVGLDGISVEKVSAEPSFNIELASAEGIHVVKRAASALHGAAKERVEEVSVSGGGTLTVLRFLGADYYLCVVARHEAIPGRVRYEAWRAGLQLRAAIA
jgi:predicted regulator of Ras-like GTPase activity (Roadblock/LC7/MglB family)